MKPHILILCFFLLVAPIWAQPTARETHEKLLLKYCPKVLLTDELIETSWQQLGTFPRVRQIWAADNSDTDITLELDTRTYYLGWLYGGQRGLDIADLRSPDTPTSLPEFDIASRPVSVIDNEIRYKKQPFDYLVVGSGPAGSVIASELAKTGASVAVIEQGPFVIPGSMDTRLPPQLKFGGGAVPARKSGIIVRNGMTVGGGSAVNVDLAFAPTLPFIQSRFRAWHDEGSIPDELWNEEQLRSAYTWVAKEIGTRTPARTEINANNRILETGARLRGITPRMYDLNTWAATPDYKNKKSGLNRLLLPGVTSKESHLVVLSDLEVSVVKTEGKRTSGVTVRARRPWNAPGVVSDPYDLKLGEGDDYFIPAKTVILSAGSQGSAAILLRSKLGGDMVGRGVVLHPSVPLIGTFNKDIHPAYGIPSTVYAVDPIDDGLIYECMSGTPEYVAYMLFVGAEQIYNHISEYRRLGGFGFLLVDEVSLGNRVILDETGQPVIAYSLSQTDKKRIAKGVQESIKMMMAAGAREVYVPTLEFPMPIRSLEQADKLAESIQFIPGKTILTSAHMQSTCKMGKSSDNSVVNSEHQVWGFTNLYVCDSSIFPSSVGANPMQTIYTVAKLFANKLVNAR